MKHAKIIFWIVGLGFSIPSFSQNRKFIFELSDLASHDAVHLKMQQKGTQKWLEFRADTFPTFFFLPGPGDGFAWGQSKYLVLETENPGLQNQVVSLRFFENHYDLAPAKQFDISVFPRIRSQLVIPLALLNQPDGFIPRFPGQLKGKYGGKSMKPDDIQRVEINVAPRIMPGGEAKIRFFHIALTQEIPQLHGAKIQPVVDSLGQWNQKKWGGKTRNFNEMKKRLSREINQPLKPEKEAKGGRKILKTGTGFFATHFDGKRWWLLDPAGKPFVASGVNQVRPMVASPISGLEYFHQYLPHPAAEGQESYFHIGKAMQINYLGTNFRKALGSEWQPAWRQLCLKQLQKGGFNCLGPQSEGGLVQSRKMPYFIQLQGFPRTSNYLFLDLPDPFDPSYPDSVAAYVRQLEPYKGDFQLIGYFLGGQPQWSLGHPNPAAELMRKNEPSHAKSILNHWLRKRYQNDIAKLNKVWKEKLSSFETLDSSKMDLSPQAEEDLMAFSEIIIDSLISPVCRMLKNTDPYHLNFGFRFSAIGQDIWYRMARPFDVFSISNAEIQLPETRHIAERSGRPVFIADYQAGALDKGLPSGGPAATNTTGERTQAIRTMMEDGFYRNEVIGMMYSAFYDRPLLGRLDGENGQIGLLDICHKPYEAVWNQMKSANQYAFKLAQHLKRPYNRAVTQAPLKDL